jgi:DNA-binding transcriptional LysR family regulator
MAKPMRWEDAQIGRRLRLRDLHVLFTVAQNGSMAKAAAKLGVSQPTVSEVIADLERLVGARLFDRSSRGIQPTPHGEALLRRSQNVFDELKQGFRDLQFLSDPTVGELRIGCPESIASSILPAILDRFWQEFPGVLVHTSPASGSVLDLPMLRAREVDLFVGLTQIPQDDEFDIETLFNDRPVIAVGLQHPLARRRKVDLAELVQHPWLLTGPHSRNQKIIRDLLQKRGLDMPRIALDSMSVHLRTNLLAKGPYVTMLPNSVLRFNANRFALKMLDVDIPASPWPVATVTLKNRTLSPIADRFIVHLREFVAGNRGLRTSDAAG